MASATSSLLLRILALGVQWLLTQYVTVNGQNAELRKKDTLAHEHIKDLERELQRCLSSASRIVSVAHCGSLYQASLEV